MASDKRQPFAMRRPVITWATEAARWAGTGVSGRAPRVATMRRSRIACGGIAVLAAAVGVLLGWLVIGGGDISLSGVDVVAVGTFVTALATLGLGAATLYLGYKTREVVAATRDGARE